LVPSPTPRWLPVCPVLAAVGWSLRVRPPNCHRLGWCTAAEQLQLAPVCRRRLQPGCRTSPSHPPADWRAATLTGSLSSSNERRHFSWPEMQRRPMPCRIGQASVCIIVVHPSIPALFAPVLHRTLLPLLLLRSRLSSRSFVPSGPEFRRRDGIEATATLPDLACSTSPLSLTKNTL